MLQAMLSGDELKSLRRAVSRAADQPPIPVAHETKFRELGLVREAEGGLGPTEKGWMALSARGLALVAPLTVGATAP